MLSCSLSLVLQQRVLCWEEKRGHGHWLGREGGKKCPGPSRRKPSHLPRVRCPCAAHPCCCKLNSGVSRLPEPGRAGENPSIALELSPESCKLQLTEHNCRTKPLLSTSSLVKSLSW